MTEISRKPLKNACSLGLNPYKPCTQTCRANTAPHSRLKGCNSQFIDGPGRPSWAAVGQITRPPLRPGGRFKTATTPAAKSNINRRRCPSPRHFGRTRPPPRSLVDQGFIRHQAAFSPRAAWATQTRCGRQSRWPRKACRH